MRVPGSCVIDAARRRQSRMNPQKRGGGIACAGGYLARTGALGDAEQQAYEQIAPQKSRELLGKLRRAALEESGFLCLGHDLSPGDPSSLTPDGVERPRDLGRLGDLGDRQAEHSN